jgi:succinate dehydrogenase / fumarate reductase, cytochrome b subunit
VLFLFLHILDTCLVGFGPIAYETFVSLYRVPVFRVLEVALSGAVLYHGMNGIRIILIDFVDNATRIQRQLWYAVWASFLVLFLPAAFFMLRPVFFPTLGLAR